MSQLLAMPQAGFHRSCSRRSMRSLTAVALLIGAASAAQLFCSQRACAAPTEQPNIVLIMADEK